MSLVGRPAPANSKKIPPTWERMNYKRREFTHREDSKMFSTLLPTIKLLLVSRLEVTYILVIAFNKGHGSQY